MHQNKGKSATTSVPSIAIRFNATAEEIEELYCKDEDSGDTGLPTDSSTNVVKTNTTASDPESSPLRSYLRLTKRSTSVDVSPLSSQDASPPSDSWKFLSDIKSKITKSVEGKLTEYKSKKELDMEPDVKSKLKENQSDTEEEESSISRTCGIISTSDGVEMSTDDETPSTSEDKKPSALKTFNNAGTSPRPSSPAKTVLFHEDVKVEDDIEDGIEAVEELFKGGTVPTNDFRDKWLDFQEVNKDEFKKTFSDDKTEQQYITFNPPNFVDLRQNTRPVDWLKLLKSFRYVILFIALIVAKSCLEIPDYICGFITGSCVTVTVLCVYIISSKVYKILSKSEQLNSVKSEEFVYDTVPPVKEHTPISKFEGWVNEYPSLYNPHTYHISETQSVYLKLKGNFLRISHTRSKIPKRSLWNEPVYNVVLTHHRIYNLLGAKITILPDGLARGKRWSKKYPICISLSSENDNVVIKKSDGDHDEVISSTFRTDVQMSKIKESDDEKTEQASTVESQTTNGHDADSEEERDYLDPLSEDADDEGDTNSFQGEFTTSEHEHAKRTKIFIFGRTDREKEIWFRRFTAATHKGAQFSPKQKLHPRQFYNISSTLIQDAKELDEFNRTMVFCQLELPYRFISKMAPQISGYEQHKELYEAMNKDIHPNVKWVNSLVGRILYDCIRSPEFIDKVKERIQKKLSAIKLPYFIEALAITELNLGTDVPLVHNCTTPVLDDRGVWIDFEITYAGLVTLILNTKLNLLKIKNKHVDSGAEEPIDEKSHPMFNSDVDDSAESSTDEEYSKYPPALDATGYPIQGLGGTSNTSKKIIKIVDKVAESKIFQAATENKYIKKAIENVSNTDLGLKVELRAVVGTLVVNIPPPPSDRIWTSFRPLPKLQLLAMPIVGERNINHMRVTSFIERKLIQEIQKLFVLPNMEDITITMMSSKLPE